MTLARVDAEAASLAERFAAAWGGPEPLTEGTWPWELHVILVEAGDAAPAVAAIAYKILLDQSVERASAFLSILRLTAAGGTVTLAEADPCPFAANSTRLVDGELEGPAREAAADHFAECAACRQDVEDALQIAVLLRSNS